MCYCQLTLFCRAWGCRVKSQILHPAGPSARQARNPESSPGTARRYYTQKRLARASRKLGIPDLQVYDQFEDRRVGLRMCTFTGPVRDLGGGVLVRSLHLQHSPACAGPCCR